MFLRHNAECIQINQISRACSLEKMWQINMKTCLCTSERERKILFIVRWVLRANVALRGCELCVPGISQGQVGWGLSADLVVVTLPMSEGLKRDDLSISSHTNHSVILSCLWEKKEIMVLLINMELFLINYLEQGGLQEACLWHCFMLIFMHAVLKKYCKPIYPLLVCSIWEIHLKVSGDVHNQRQSS